MPEPEEMQRFHALLEAMLTKLEPVVPFGRNADDLREDQGLAQGD
ncbi:hypothetical protein [Brevundimonas sp. Root1423]|nr:hypothetical protein [Brevundimonas sp. Root1423]